MAVINRVPRGFLGLLDAKTLGRSPDDVLPDVRGVVDLTSFYLDDIPMRVEEAEDLSGNTSPGAYCPITVPNTEAWYVYVIGAVCIALGDSTSTSLGLDVVFPSGTNSVQMVVPFSTFQLLTSERGTVGRTFETPFFVPPGTTFRAVENRSNGIIDRSYTLGIAYRSVVI